MVCLYIKASVETPESCDLCKFGEACARVNMFMASKLVFNELDNSTDEFDELYQVLGKQEYDGFCKVLDYLIKRVRG